MSTLTFSAAQLGQASFAVGLVCGVNTVRSDQTESDGDWSSIAHKIWNADDGSVEFTDQESMSFQKMLATALNRVPNGDMEIRSQLIGLNEWIQQSYAGQTGADRLVGESPNAEAPTTQNRTAFAGQAG